MMTTVENNTKTTPTPLPRCMPVRSGLLQRKCACNGSPGLDGECEECRRRRLSLRRKSRNSEPGTEYDSSVPPIVHEVLRSPGKPLDPVTLAFMEPRFGHDFRHVRLNSVLTTHENMQSS